MDYTFFKDAIKQYENQSKAENKDIFAELIQNKYENYWVRYLKKDLLNDRGSYSGNTLYSIEKFFGKKAGIKMFDNLLENIKNECSPINFSIALNSDFLSYQEKINHININREKLTMRHWQYFFNYLSYNGSKLLKEIGKNYHFEKYNKLNSFNKAFFNVIKKIDFQPYEEREKPEEKEHISRINMQGKLFIELSELGLDPTAKVKKIILIEKKVSSIEYLIYKKQNQLLSKIMNLNIKRDNPFYLRNEAAVFAWRSSGKGINKHTMLVLLKQTKPEYLLEDFSINPDIKNIEMILRNILYSGDYHKKNIEFLVDMLSLDDLRDNISQSGKSSRTDYLEKMKDFDWLNDSQREKIESIIAKDEKYLLEKTLSSFFNKKENKIRI